MILFMVPQDMHQPSSCLASTWGSLQSCWLKMWDLPCLKILWTGSVGTRNSYAMPTKKHLTAYKKQHRRIKDCMTGPFYMVNKFWFWTRGGDRGANSVTGGRNGLMWLLVGHTQSALCTESGPEGRAFPSSQPPQAMPPLPSQKNNCSQKQ